MTEYRKSLDKVESKSVTYKWMLDVALASIDDFTNYKYIWVGTDNLFYKLITRIE
jgi:hypothetical protein